MSRADNLEQALARVMAAERPTRAWISGSQIPWDDPEFSRRMLDVHLDASTHMASRSPAVINMHLDWLETQLTAAGLQGGHVLDAGCGPGLYCHELARRGHRTTGFDFSPAPLDWARDTAKAEGLDCDFFAADLTDLPSDFEVQVGSVDAVTFWFGEFHSFPPPVAAEILRRLAALLKPGGLFVLEYQPWDIFVTEDSSQWSVEEKSVFSDEPHLWLQEFFWDEDARTEVHVHWIIERQSGNLKRYVQCHQGWADGELAALLQGAGLVDPVYHPPITGCDPQFEFPVVVTKKGAPGADRNR